MMAKNDGDGKRTLLISVDVGADGAPVDTRLMAGIYCLIETMLPQEVDMGSDRLGRVAAWVWDMWGNGRQPGQEGITK